MGVITIFRMTLYLLVSPEYVDLHLGVEEFFDDAVHLNLLFLVGVHGLLN